MAITDKNYVSHSIASLETLVMEQKPNYLIDRNFLAIHRIGHDTLESFCLLTSLRIILRIILTIIPYWDDI